MKRFLTLALFPAIGLLLLGCAFFWGQREIRLRLSGQPAEGRIIGMVLQRADHADIIAGLDTRIVLALANGERIEVEYRDYTFVTARHFTSTEAALNTESPAPPTLSAADLDALLDPELRRVLTDAVRGNGDIIRWALLRESRRPEVPRRVLRIEKTDTAHGHFGVASVPAVFPVEAGRIVLDAPTGVARIHAVFDRSELATVQANKSETLVAYEYVRQGESITPARRDFLLAAEPYATQFQPIFAFVAEGTEVARLSHIGRHGGPTLALRLFGECRVYYDRNDPTDAMLTALPGDPDGAPLAWFSRLCEGIFAQWGSTVLIALAGGIFIVTGLLVISLCIFPPRPAPTKAQFART